MNHFILFCSLRSLDYARDDRLCFRMTRERIHRSSFIVYRLSFIVYRSSFIVYRSSFIPAGVHFLLLSIYMYKAL